MTPTGTEAAVCQDIAERQAKGIKKYGTTVADNPLELQAWLQHAYEETLDQAIYLKRAIEEIERKESPRKGFVLRTVEAWLNRGAVIKAGPEGVVVLNEGEVRGLDIDFGQVRKL